MMTTNLQRGASIAHALRVRSWPPLPTGSGSTAHPLTARGLFSSTQTSPSTSSSSTSARPQQRSSSSSAHTTQETNSTRTSTTRVVPDVDASSSSTSALPVAIIRCPKVRDSVLREHQLWLQDDKITNISELSNRRLPMGSLVRVQYEHDVMVLGETLSGTRQDSTTTSSNPNAADETSIATAESEDLGVGIWNRSAGITIRMLLRNRIKETNESGDDDKTSINRAPPQREKEAGEEVFAACQPKKEVQIRIQEEEAGYLEEFGHFLEKRLLRSSRPDATELSLYSRLINAEADGVPATIVDRHGPRAAVISYLSYSSFAFYHEKIVEVLKNAGIENIGMHRIVVKKEKYSMAGEEFATSMVAGNDAVFVVREPIEVGVVGSWRGAAATGSTMAGDCEAASSSAASNPGVSTSSDRDAVERPDDFLDLDSFELDSGVAAAAAAGSTSTTTEAGRPGATSTAEQTQSAAEPQAGRAPYLELALNLYQCTGVYERSWPFDELPLRRFLADLARGGTVLDLWCRVGEIGLRCARGNRDGAAAAALEVIMIEERQSFAVAAIENARRNRLDTSNGAGATGSPTSTGTRRNRCNTTVLHKPAIYHELRSMALAGLRFSLVVLNCPLHFEYKQKHDGAACVKQFGKKWRVDLKGIASMVKLAALVTATDGYMAVKINLAPKNRSWGPHLIRLGIQGADRCGSVVKEFLPGGGLPRVMAEEVIQPHWYVVRVH